MAGKAVRTVVRRMMDAPEALLNDIALTDDEETAALMELSRGADLEYDRTQTWLSLFWRQVQEGPERTAVADGVFPGVPDGSRNDLDAGCSSFRKGHAVSFRKLFIGSQQGAVQIQCDQPDISFFREIFL